MKKFVLILLALAMILSVSACSGSSGSSSGGSSNSSDTASELDTMPLDEIMDKILDGVADLPQPLLENDLSSEEGVELFKNYAFIDYIDGTEALSSEAGVSAIAHSVVLLRMPEDVDIEDVAADIEANADPRKWICVEAEKVTVSTNGRLILLVMSSEARADAITENFLALK